MKKLMNLCSVVCFATVVAFFIVSCKKDLGSKKDPEVKINYVESVQASFIAEQHDVSLKSGIVDPVLVNRTWTMLARNSKFYGNVPFALVKGNEFPPYSDARIYWSNPANNPTTYPVNQGVYSNLTPVEDVRLITEVKDAANKVAYLGIVDFNPTSANFPLKVPSFRLGDILQINANALTSLPGGQNLTISVKFNLYPVDVEATKIGTISGTGGTPNGTSFTWADVHYGSPVLTTITAGSGDFVLYQGIDSKVKGDIIITITDGGSSLVLEPIAARGPGLGAKIVLTTNKVGWFDSKDIEDPLTNIGVEVITKVVD